MANGVIVQFAAASGFAAIVLCVAFFVYRKTKAPRVHSPEVLETPVVVEMPDGEPRNPPEFTVALGRTEAAPQTSQTVILEPANVKDAVGVRSVSSTATDLTEEKLPVVVHMQPGGTNREDRNQRILADISANIRKSLIKPVPTYSPVQFPEAPRETEYVRVKKQIITPHGQVRFSILKDTISSNMLAVFRRASQEWKTPDDLIGFIPSYLKPEAEILNSQVLLVGTPGHNEKLAIPIRNVDAESNLYECFDFVADARTATNTPAVLLASDDEYEVVSRGVITQPVFVNRAEWSHPEVKFLVEKAPEALQA